MGVEVEAGGDVVDISGSDQTMPDSMVKLLEGGESLVNKAKRWSIFLFYI